MAPVRILWLVRVIAGTIGFIAMQYSLIWVSLDELERLCWYVAEIQSRLPRQQQEFRWFMTFAITASVALGYIKTMLSTVIVPHWRNGAYLVWVRSFPKMACILMLFISPIAFPKSLFDRYIPLFSGVNLVGGLLGVI